MMLIVKFAQIVPKHSAIIPGYPHRGIHANHQDMAKFKSADDPGYKSVLGVLRRWMREIEETLTSNLNSSRSAKETRKQWPNLPQERIIHQGSSVFYGQNNSGGGMIIQGNNISSPNGSISFGK